MNIETEFKYVVNKLPTNLPKPYYMEQSYFYLSDHINLINSIFKLDDYNDITTSRIRLIKHEKEEYVITLKSRGLMTRREYEKNVTKETYLEIMSGKLKSTIIKNRYKITIDKLTFEFDEYLNLNEPLITVEVETNQPELYEAKIKDILENYFKISYIDVTFDASYKNSNLIKKFGLKK